MFLTSYKHSVELLVFVHAVDTRHNIGQRFRKGVEIYTEVVFYRLETKSHEEKLYFNHV